MSTVFVGQLIQLGMGEDNSPPFETLQGAKDWCAHKIAMVVGSDSPPSLETDDWRSYIRPRGINWWLWQNKPQENQVHIVAIITEKRVYADIRDYIASR